LSPSRAQPHPVPRRRRSSRARAEAGTATARTGKSRRWLFALGLILIVGALYRPAWHGELLWDDDQHVTRPELRPVQGLIRIWTDLGATQQYYPLVHSVFWAQHRLWGDDTTGYHLVNIGLHGVAALLVLAILRRLQVPGAALAALLFAIHPVHVESVAWISELKNTLSGVCYLAAAFTYLRFDEGRLPRLWAASLGWFLLALLSKAVTATLPAALLVVFWWQRGRVDIKRDVRPLVPFFVLGLASGLFTTWVEWAVIIGPERGEFHLSLIERLLLAGRVVWFYFLKIVWPDPLVFSYPRWSIDAAVWWQYLFPAALLALAVLLWRGRRRSRAPFAALLLFVGTLAPVLGLLDVYPFRFSFVADHFQYLATIPVLALAAAALWHVADGKLGRAGLAAIVLFVGSPLAATTWAHAGRFAEAETLYRATLRDNPDSWLAHGQLGLDLHRKGRLEDALAEYEAARRLRPTLTSAHSNACAVLWQLGRPDAALEACAEALRTDPGSAEAHYNSGMAERLLGRTDAARAHFASAARLAHGYAQAHYQLGLVEYQAGRFEGAIVEYRKAIDAAPDLAVAQSDLGSALAQVGRADEAVDAFRRALELDPGLTDAAFNLGTMLMALGRHEEAVSAYGRVVARRPGDVQAHNNLGAAKEGLGRLQEAAGHYREALRLDPAFHLARENLMRVERVMDRGGR
jgi:tetratricopeptide (TPR) repeat protein